MRKFTFLLCCVMLLQLFAGCSGNNEEIEKPVSFYYINNEISYNSPEAVISDEIREGAQFQSLEDLLAEYLDGPVSSELQTLIPSNVSLLSCVVNRDTADIYLSSQFSELSGINLTIACSAMLLTVHDFSGVQSICVYAENEKLDDKETFLLSLDDIVLVDTVTSEEPKE